MAGREREMGERGRERDVKKMMVLRVCVQFMLRRKRKRKKRKKEKEKENKVG